MIVVTTVVYMSCLGVLGLSVMCYHTLSVHTDAMGPLYI